MRVTHAPYTLVACAALISFIGYVNTEPGACLTPHGLPGACVDLKLCPHLLDAAVRNRSARSDQHLRNSICERPTTRDVKVCCERPACVTDGGLAGACSPRQACPGAGGCGEGRSCCPRRSLDGYVSPLTWLPEFGFCGVSDEPASANRTTSPRQYPWTALLVYGAGGRGIERCAGALVSARFVLTAAHCVLPDLARVRLGVHNISRRCDDVRAGCPFETSVANVTVLPSYERSTGAGDLALITTSEPAPYTKHIRPICLPDRRMGDVIINQLFTTGWGVSPQLDGSRLLAPDQTPSRSDLPLRSADVCAGAVKLWTGLLMQHPQNATVIPASGFCAGGTFHSELCAQDSGGALAWSSPSGRTAIMAVHAASPAPCRAPVPAVYTPVAQHLEWIVREMAEYYASSGLRNRLVFRTFRH